MLKYSENQYNGVWIDASFLPEDAMQFKLEVSQLIALLHDNKLLWIRLPIERADFVPVLASLGFVYHHCEELSLTLLKKLADDALVPTTKNFIVGVGAVVIHNRMLLVVKDRFSEGYKLPGGHVDKQESLTHAVEREVLEETGVRVEFESVMNIGHFRQGQFGEANLYIVCTAKALSTAITINDSMEIREALWMDPEVFMQLPETNNYNKTVVEAAINNTTLKLTLRKIKLRVEGGEVFL